MSRLESHQQKQFVKKVIFYVLLLCIVLFFIFTTGLKLLINASLFISNLGTNKNTTAPLEKKDTFYGNVEVDSIPTATNSAQFYISGSVLNFDSIEFYINGNKVKQKTVSDSDSFNEKIGDLQKGQNEVYVKAIAKSNQKQSQKYSVFYKADKPKLDISSPSDNSTVNKQNLTINGTTDQEVFVKINDSPVVVQANGAFTYNIKLKDGENKITIVAADEAGNQETKTLTIQYKKDD